MLALKIERSNPKNGGSEMPATIVKPEKKVWVIKEAKKKLANLMEEARERNGRNGTEPIGPVLIQKICDDYCFLTREPLNVNNLMYEIAMDLPINK